jgi:hypothetical protein
MDAWRWNVENGRYREPPCPRCGVVGAQVAWSRPHFCNPTHVQMMAIGQENVERIARAIRTAFAALRDD